MFVANYSIVDWCKTTYGMWLSNCSDDINSPMCDYVTQVTWKVTNSSWNTSMTNDSLADLMVEWHLLALNLSSKNKLGLNNGTSGNFLQTLKTWNLDWIFHRDESQS